jgi:uncharacterized protein involved in outer membrane biogenesis
MSIRLSRKTLAVAVIGLLVAYAAFGWLALPRIIQSEAESYVAVKTGRHLALDRPEFNPFTLDLGIGNIALSEADGKPLFALHRLEVKLSLSSLLRRALAFDLVRLDGPQAEVILRRDGKLNWSVLLDTLKGDGQQSRPDTQEALPRLYIRRFVLSEGGLDFSDDRTGFSTRLAPLSLELTDISTLPGKQDSYEVDAHTASGANIVWEGRMELSPIEIQGTLQVEGQNLAELSPYLKGLLPVPPPTGKLSLATDYRAAFEANRFNLTLDNARAKVSDFNISLTRKPGPGLAIDALDVSKVHFDLGSSTLSLGTLSVKGTTITGARSDTAANPLLRVEDLGVNDVHVDLAHNDLQVGGITLTGGELKAVRYVNGRLNVEDALREVSATLPAKPAEPSAGKATPWRYRINKFELAGFSAAFHDRAVEPVADLVASDISFDASDISDNLSNPLPVEATLRSRDGGMLNVSGTIVPSGPSADLQVKLAALSLKPAQPYLGHYAKLTLQNGQLNIDGHATYGKRGGRFRGGFSLRNLRLVESETGDTFLAWTSLGSRDVKATEKSVDVGELGVDGLECKLIINKDKTLNVGHIINRPETAPEAPAPAGNKAVAASASSAGKETVPPFAVNIDRIKISNGSMNYADYSLVLPFATSIHDLTGSLVGLSSRPGTAGQLELDGQVDDYGIARALGQINLFDPLEETDIRVVFRNVEMVRLTPYSSTFAGRKIVSGKLSLDLEYKIKNRQLQGDNQIVMDKLTLGERVASPGAMNLPLDLAIAILEDSDGRIDLGLPVSGSLDDPHFSYGAIIWKAILNVITKIATAPFRALGALFGGGEKFETIAFDFGKPNFSPPEREKLVHLADALNKRPRLLLTVHGVYADADRVALQDLHLRRTVARMAGQRVGDQEDPGPLSTGSTKVQAALESLYSKRTSSGELAALKAAYRAANPGQLEEGTGEKMMSLLSGLFREKRTLDVREVAQLKGTDFYAVLFERLRNRETVADAELQDLAAVRGSNTIAALGADGLPPARMQLGAPEKVDAREHDVPLKLDLAPVTQPVQQPSAAPPAQSGTGPAEPVQNTVPR